MTPAAPKLFFDAEMIDHAPGPGHPECPERLQGIIDHLAQHCPDHHLHSAPPIDRDGLTAVHTADYVDAILALRGQHSVLDPDTMVGPPTVDAALRAAGCAVAAADWTIDHQQPAMALVRPPGHHAEPGRAMGFCIFNNIAIAAAHATNRADIDRVLIIDWDVHHGNGTQDAFYRRDDVLFFSTHQSPFYPGTGAADETGAGDGEGFTINIPLPAGTGDDELIAAFEQALLPAARKFKPDLLLISAGFDAHCLDPVGGMQLTTDGFGELLALVLELSRTNCPGQVALILEGGYHIEALSRCVRRCIDGLQNYH